MTTSLSFPAPDVRDRDPRVQAHRQQFGLVNGFGAPESFHRSRPRYDWMSGMYVDPFDGAHAMQHGEAALVYWPDHDPQWCGEFGAHAPPELDEHVVGRGGGGGGGGRGGGGWGGHGGFGGRGFFRGGGGWGGWGGYPYPWWPWGLWGYGYGDGGPWPWWMYPPAGPMYGWW